MQYFVDTGVMLRLFDQVDSEHSDIRDLLRSLHAVTTSRNSTNRTKAIVDGRPPTRPLGQRGQSALSSLRPPVQSLNHRVPFRIQLHIFLFVSSRVLRGYSRLYFSARLSVLRDLCVLSFRLQPLAPTIHKAVH